MDFGMIEYHNIAGACWAEITVACKIKVLPIASPAMGLAGPDFNLHPLY